MFLKTKDMIINFDKVHRLAIERGMIVAKMDNETEVMIVACSDTEELEKFLDILTREIDLGRRVVNVGMLIESYNTNTFKI